MALEAPCEDKGGEGHVQSEPAGLLYDMYKYREAADVMREIPAINPEFDASAPR